MIPLKSKRIAASLFVALVCSGWGIVEVIRYVTTPTPLIADDAIPMTKDEVRDLLKQMIENKHFAASTIVAQTVEAMEVKVLDDNGKLRMALVGDHDNPSVGPNIRLFADEGHTSLQIFDTPHGAGIQFYDPQGVLTLQVVQSKAGPLIGFPDEAGKPRMILARQENGVIMFSDAAGRSAALDGAKVLRLMGN